MGFNGVNIYTNQAAYNDNISDKMIRGTKPGKGTGKNGTAHKGQDTIEISREAYRLQSDRDGLSASSGKDVLRITKGEKEDSYVIHFSDSAMVNRAVSRGYITVNGVNIQLSDEDKKKMLEADKEAQAKREAAFAAYVMEHEMAVARQQSEALSGANKNRSKVMEIMSRLSKGGKVSGEEMRLLMETDPKLYAMAMAFKAMQGKGKQDNNNLSKEAGSPGETEETARDGVSWNDFEWKTCETQMNVSLAGTPKVESVSTGEVKLG